MGVKGESKPTLLLKGELVWMLRPSFEITFGSL
jgi:hypothetical protein